MKRYGLLLLISLIMSGVCAKVDNAWVYDDKSDKAIRKDMEEIKRVVEEAAQFFAEHSLGVACSSFNNDIKRWYRGKNDGIEVFDSQGNCYLFGSSFQYLWDKFTEKKDQGSSLVPTTLFSRERLFDQNFIQRMVEIGDNGGGWVSFNWNDALNYSYAKTVIKNGVKYVIFAGFYPESASFKIQQLVKSAVLYGEEKGADSVFQQINNPLGPFVDGDDYLFAYSLDGTCFAHGHNPAFIGQNFLAFQDYESNYPYRKMIEIAKSRGAGWVQNNNNGLMEYIYFELFKDPRTKQQYIIGGGYYPFINEETVVSFVKRAVEYLKAQGSTVALRDFTSYSGGFIVGPLRLTVMDTQGNVLADAGDPILIGHNILQVRDSEGKYIAKEAIEATTKQGSAWISSIEKHAYKMSYAELVETPDGKFIVGAGFWPSSKEKSAGGLAQKAAIFLKNHSLADSLSQFTVLNSHFFRGDLFVSVYDMDGICFAYGIDTSRIWTDEKKILDADGFPIIDKILATARQGGGWTEYKDEYGLRRRAYAIEVIKPLPYMPELETVELETKKVVTPGVTRMETVVKGAPKHESYVVVVGYYI